MDLSKYLTSQDTQDKRINTCKVCDQYIKSTKLCGKCLCYMPWKVQLAPASCPLHKWLHETIETPQTTID